MQKLEDARKYQSWKATLERNGITIRGMEELKTVRKGNGEVLFSMVKIDAVADTGEPLLPVALIRGHFVTVTTCLVAAETGEDFFLLVAQRRVADGTVHYEHPAGMMDSEADPYEVAVKEVEEETGLNISREDLTLHNQEMWFSSPGLQDEGGYFFKVRLTMPLAQIQALHDNETGDGGEHEYIRTHIATYDEARRLIRNTNGLLGLFLFAEEA